MRNNYACIKQINKRKNSYLRIIDFYKSFINLMYFLEELFFLIEIP